MLSQFIPVCLALLGAVVLAAYAAGARLLRPKPVRASRQSDRRQ